MLSLAVPLVALYEISVFCVMLIEKQRLKEAALRASQPQAQDVTTRMNPQA
jgi:Sec-independent protein secretion pathway component TatC